METTDLFIKNTAKIQLHCTKDQRDKLQNMKNGTTVYQTDEDIGEYVYNGLTWNIVEDPIEPEITPEDIVNIKKIPSLCTLDDVINYITDNRDVIETIKNLIDKLDTKSDKDSVYTKDEIDNKLLAMSLNPASSLKTKNGSVSVGTSAYPRTNQVLTAVSKDVAIWTEIPNYVTPLMYSKIISRLEDLEQYKRETETKKQLSAAPKKPSSISFK